MENFFHQLSWSTFIFVNETHTKKPQILSEIVEHCRRSLKARSTKIRGVQLFIKTLMKLWVNFVSTFVFTHFREKLVWKSGHFHKTCFLGKLLLLIHLHFNPVIKFHIDEDDTFISASTKYELNRKRVLLDGSVCMTSHDLQTSVTMWTICSYSLSSSKVLW